MPELHRQWKIGTVGDAIRRRVTIDRTKGGIPAGLTITKAWLTVRDIDAAVAAALVEKIITTTDVPGTGQIEDDGGGNVDIVVRFDLGNTDTIAIGADEDRLFDVQVLASDSNPYTAENGRVYCELAEVTTETS